LDGCCCGHRGAHGFRAGSDPAFHISCTGCTFEGATERSTFDRQCQALFAGVQPCSPASHPASFIHHDGGRTTGAGDEPE
jgi:hypothetical protein